MKSNHRHAAVGLLASMLACSSTFAFPLRSPSDGDNHHNKRSQQLALDLNFPDPSIEQAWDGTWYAFATTGNGFNIQVASASSPDGPWTWLDRDALPASGAWTTGNNNWAPDVKRMPPESQSLYIMTYSGELASNSAHHCIGIATSHDMAGPYTPHDTPVICPDVASTGGAIDSSSYYDEPNNKRYVVYKEDGNSVGSGGNCGNSIAPIHSTPIMLQEMSASDWTTPVGTPVQILDRSDDDGPLVEAPNIIGTADGHYVLFYSSHCFDDPAYDVKYAVSATGIAGPYVRQGQLIAGGDFSGLASPGGATATPGGDVLLFHADCAGATDGSRCMHTVDMSIVGGVVSLVALWHHHTQRSQSLGEGE